MDKIYTRKRIRMPYIKYNGIQKGRMLFRRKIVLEIIIILLIAIITLITIIRAINPIIDRICEDAAKTKATIVSNNIATEVMKNYKYNDLINLHRDKNGNITMIQSNIVTINEITSDVAVKIQKELINSEESMGEIRFRKYYGN